MLLVALFVAIASTPKAPANFLIILADDVGSGVMGWSCGWVLLLIVVLVQWLAADLKTI